MSLMWMCFFHTFNWTVCCMYWTGVSGVGSTGVVGANATIRLSEAPVRLHYTCPIYHSLYSNSDCASLGGF